MRQSWRKWGEEIDREKGELNLDMVLLQTTLLSILHNPFNYSVFSSSNGAEALGMFPPPSRRL